jgi:hypothetical protein
MATHLYLCDNGGPMTLAFDGTPPQWATCAVCVSSLECPNCPGAQLQGEAPAFPVASRIRYRCQNGHERTVMLAEGTPQPESTHCPDCGGMLLPVAWTTPSASA